MSKNILSTALGLSLALNVLAQDALSLSDAITIGLERNFDISIEEKNVLVAQNNNNWGEAGRYPTITLNLGQNNSLTNNVKTASPFQLQDKIISNSLSPAVNLNWTLFNGFSVQMNKRRFEQLQAESEGNASIVIANTIQAIILGYYNVVLEYQRLEELEKQMALSKDKFDYIQVKSDLGSAVSTELFVEEGNFLTDSINYINQQLLTRNALRNLNILLNETDPERQWVLTDDLGFETPNYEYNDLRQKLFNQNVDLKKQYLTQSVLNTNVGLAKTARYPSLALVAGASENRSSVDLSKASFPSSDGGSTPGPEDPLTAITDTYFANFTLSFTLFNGGKINRAIRNAVIQEDIGNLRVQKLERSLERDLRQSLDLYNIRKQIHEINLRREEVARINLDISAEKFRNGSINSFDYRTIQNNYLSAAILRLQAKYNLIDAHIGLMRLTGGIIETYN